MPQNVLRLPFFTTGIARGAVGADTPQGGTSIFGLNLGEGISCKCTPRGQDCTPGMHELTFLWVGEGIVFNIGAI